MPKQDKEFCRENFLFIHYFENSTRYEIKSAKYSFFSKKGFVFKILEKLSYYWIQAPKSPFRKNLKKKKIQK